MKNTGRLEPEQQTHLLEDTLQILILSGKISRRMYSSHQGRQSQSIREHPRAQKRSEISLGRSLSQGLSLNFCRVLSPKVINAKEIRELCSNHRNLLRSSRINFNGNKTFGGGHFFKLGEVHEKRFEYLPIPKISTKHCRISKKIDLEKQIPRKPLFNIKQSPPQQLDLKPVSSPVRKSRTRKAMKTNKDRAGIEIYNSFDFATRLRAFSVSPSRSFKAEYWKKFRGTERPRRMDNLAYPK